MKTIISSSVEYSTEWFDLVARRVEGDLSGKPYFCLELTDYVAVLALTARDEVLMVRQYRPAVDRYTLELPAGHVDSGETPEQAGRRELLEETGYRADRVESLGCLFPDTGRLANRMWCFFAGGLEPVAQPEEGLELHRIATKDLLARAGDGRLEHALHTAIVGLALIRGKLSL